jgi:hypothetical protein
MAGSGAKNVGKSFHQTSNQTVVDTIIMGGGIARMGVIFAKR